MSAAATGSPTKKSVRVAPIVVFTLLAVFVVFSMPAQPSYAAAKLSSVTLGAFTASPADVGQSDGVTVSWSNGAQPFTVTLYYTTSPTACSSSGTVAAGPTQTTASPLSMSFVAPSPANTYNFCATVTDSARPSPSTVASTATYSLTVYADPTVAVSPVGPLTFIQGGTASTLTATVTYSGPNTATVEWYSSSTSSCSGSSTYTGITGTSFTPSTSSTGTEYYCAVVTDSGVPSYSATSNVVEVTIVLPPTVNTYTTSGCAFASSSFNLGSTVYGSVATYNGGVTTPMKLEYVDPSGSSKRTVTGLSGSTYCDGGYALQPTDSTGSWTLKLYDNNNVLIASSNFTVNAAIPEFPLGALFLLFPIIMVYLLARGRTRLEQG